jgi:hypothetical protein
MARLNRTAQIRKLAEDEAKIRAKLAQLKAAESADERKRDTRRKVLIGSMLLRLVEQGEWTRERLDQMLDKYLTRSDDRALFGLPTDPAGTPAVES